jgi:DNA-binding NarL/FixJ family response regulator
MDKQRIILINGSRLLRELLHIVIYKAQHLEIVQEIHDLNELPAAIQASDADWVIISLPLEEKMPAWVDDYIARHPAIRFLIVSNDGSRIKMKWLESHEQDLDDLSLKDLIQLLESAPQQV